MSWAHYEPLRGLVHISSLRVVLFNPKLVLAATSGRRPDIYFNSTVHSYVECVFTKAYTQTARRDVEKHILRFFRVGNAQSAHYEIQYADYAILHYQDWGTSPMQLEDETCKQCFNDPPEL